MGVEQNRLFCTSTWIAPIFPILFSGTGICIVACMYVHVH